MQLQITIKFQAWIFFMLIIFVSADLLWVHPTCWVCYHQINFWLNSLLGGLFYIQDYPALPLSETGIEFHWSLCHIYIWLSSGWCRRFKLSFICITGFYFMTNNQFRTEEKRICVFKNAKNSTFEHTKPFFWYFLLLFSFVAFRKNTLPSICWFNKKCTFVKKSIPKL